MHLTGLALLTLVSVGTHAPGVGISTLPFAGPGCAPGVAPIEGAALASHDLTREYLEAHGAPALAAPQDSGSDKVTGTVRGFVRFDGKRPKVNALTVSTEQSKGCCAAGETVNDTDRSLLIDDKLSIADVVVSLTVPGVKVPIPDEPVVFNQAGCRFEPHLLVVPAGATVNFRNSDGCAHNIHIYCLKNQGFNRTIPAGKDIKATFKRTESIKVTCDIHPWMSGRVVVTDATHWAITGSDGSFALKGVPPGTYEVKVWQQTLGTVKASVTVAADGSCETMNVKMAPKKARRTRR